MILCKSRKWFVSILTFNYIGGVKEDTSEETTGNSESSNTLVHRKIVKAKRRSR